MSATSPEMARSRKQQIADLLRAPSSHPPGRPGRLQFAQSDRNCGDARRVGADDGGASGRRSRRVSLLVGGVGIMNIMLVSVTERTREIGLRMAMGARNRDILRQFLCEAVVLSMSGGLIGIVLGVAASHAISRSFRLGDARLSERHRAIGALRARVGIFFGYYPATRAATLDPIEALRYE